MAKASYWRGVRRQARKETREALFGSAERVVKEFLGYLVYLGVAYLVLSATAMHDELTLGLAAAAVPVVSYPIIYWYKLFLIPPRLRTKAKRAEEAKLRTIGLLEERVAHLERVSAPQFKMTLMNKAMYGDSSVKYGWYLKVESRGTIPFVAVNLDLTVENSGFIGAPTYQVRATWDGRGLANQVPIFDGTSESALVHFIEIRDSGVTPKVRWVADQKIHEISGFSFPFAETGLASTPVCTMRVIVTSGHGSQTFIVSFKGQEIVSTSGDVPIIERFQ